MMDLPGGVAPPEHSVDQGVAWHFGDPFGEQRAATRSVALFDRSHRGVIVVSGEDRLSWLHSLTTQHLNELRDGQGTEGLVLTIQGRVEHHFALAELDGQVFLDTEPVPPPADGGPAQGALFDYLRSMVFWSKVEPRAATEEYGLLTLVGPQTRDVLAAVGLPMPARDVVITAAGGFVRGTSWPGAGAVDLMLPRAELTRRWAELRAAGAVPSGSMAWEALRVESLIPRLGMDTDDKTIPHEVSWIPRAVHLHKGCYRGQETVARVQNLGRPPRRMVLLHLDSVDEDPPAPGEPVTSGGRAVGRIGTAVRHHELGGIALALLKRSVPADAELTVGNRAARIDPDSIPAEEGPQPGRQAVARLRGGPSPR